MAYSLKCDLKKELRNLLNFLHLDLTRNLQYDRLTKVIIKQVINGQDMNCIDVGCHKGEIMDIFLKNAPKGHHFGFEPIPELYHYLKRKYKEKATIYPLALSDYEGSSTFQWVKNAPAYSGLNIRSYKTKDPDIEEIDVNISTLDNVIPKECRIDFIKIDVEGGELGVLRGGKELLKRNHPFILFECGLGASDYYGTTPEALYSFLTQDVEMRLSTLKTFLKKEAPLTLQDFLSLYRQNKEYYFIAY